MAFGGLENIKLHLPPPCLADVKDHEMINGYHPLPLLPPDVVKTTIYLLSPYSIRWLVLAKCMTALHPRKCTRQSAGTDLCNFMNASATRAFRLLRCAGGAINSSLFVPCQLLYNTAALYLVCKKGLYQGHFLSSETTCLGYLKDIFIGVA